MSEDTIALYFRKYDRIYDPVANAAAIEELNARIGRRVREQQLYRKKPQRDE